MKRLLQSLMLGAGLVTAGFFAQAAVTSVAAAPATVAETEDETLGTEENPYTVSDICAMEEAIAATKDVIESGVWVEGYIIGNIPSSNFDDAIVGADGASATNLLLSPTPAYRGEVIPVELPKGDVRTALNLQDNPENVGKQVKLYGNIQRYFGVPGFKGVTKYEFVEEAETPVNIDYATFNAYFYNAETDDELFAELKADGDVYKAENVEFPGGEFGLMLVGSSMEEMFLGPIGDMVDENNLSCTLEYFNMNETHGFPTTEPIPVVLEGTYNMTVAYDGTKANVTFEKVGGDTPVLPTIDYASFNGILFGEEDDEAIALSGEANEYKAENVELNGEYLFMLANTTMEEVFMGDEMAMIDEDNLSCTLEYVNRNDVTSEPMGGPVSLNLTGTYNIYVVYEGTQAIVTFEKVTEVVTLSGLYIQLNTGVYYGEETADGTLVKNVKVVGEDYLQIMDMWGDYYFGGVNFDDVVINDAHLSATLDRNFDWLPAIIDLVGYYDVLLKVSPDASSVDVTFTKTGELTTTVNVAVEDGMAFSYNVENFSETSFNVATSDSFWNITGYTLNGVPTRFESPVGTYTHEFTAENACDFVFNVEFDGTVKILDGTTGMVEFDESAIQIKLVDGNVEIENLTAGEEVMVYSVSGQIIKSDVAHGTSMTVQLEKGAVYVVRAGKVAVKVAL